MLNRVLLAVSALLLGSSALVGVGFSGATWTEQSNTPVLVEAANDWTPPTVTVSPLAAGIYGTTTVTATAEDRSSIASVTVEYAAAGSTTWTPLTLGCTASAGTSPLVYSCDWDTTLVADGDYEVRAQATDALGYSATSAVVTTQVVNAASVVLSPVASPVSGTVSLTSTFYQAVNPTAKMYIEYQTGATWTQIQGCFLQATTTLTCSWDTTAAPFADGTYNIRARATAGGGDYLDEQASVVVDNTAPVVDLTVPTGTLSGTVDLAATASDAATAVASVTFEYQLQGAGSWTSCGTDTTAPYSCSLDTSGLTDGSTYNFRATATDAAGNASSAATQSRTVSNAPGSVSITSPAAGSTVSGTSVVAAATASSDRGVSSVRIDARLVSGGSFAPICTDTTAPYSCTWDVSGLSNGSYELRAVLTETYGGGTVTSSAVPVTVNNSVGSVSITSPIAGSTVSGSIPVTAVATAGGGSTVSSVRFEAGPVGGPYLPVCGPDFSAPYTCNWDTTTVTYAATYELRAVMLQSNLASVTSSITVSVDNVAASVSINSPANNGRVRGSAVAVNASATVTTLGVTVSSVRMEWRPTGGAFATLCTDATSPYSCTWDTTALAYGIYELRAVMTLSNGATRTSSTVSVTVDNRVLAAADIQASNGNGTPASGDTLAFTYSTIVNLATVRGSAWDGTATTVALDFMDTLKNGNTTGKDAIRFTDAQLGWVAFDQNYIAGNQEISFSATMTASNATGVTVVTVTFGTVPTIGNKLSPPDASAGTMRWTPSVSVLDLFNTPCTAATRSETGTSDNDL